MAGAFPLTFSREVSVAIESSRPVVALESTIITHGMPYPQNLTTAREVEAIVRSAGATPATVAVIDGALRIGLTDGNLARLASEGHSSAKASRKDLALLIVTGQTAGTAVATTMQIAALAGISVFATGGIGGVHRGEANIALVKNNAALAASIAVALAGKQPSTRF